MPDRIGRKVRERLKALTLRMSRPDLGAEIAAQRPAANEYGLDPFGFELDYALAGSAPFVWLYKHYFRCEPHGLERVPEGPVLLVSNHSGQLPFDGAMVGMSLLVDAERPRVVRSMVERWMPTLPYVSVFFARMGQVVGTPENARRLLRAGEAILVFPEGVRGLNKPWSRRYQLADFGTGFMRLALETGTPIVPVAVIGAEEQAPKIADLKPLARLLGMPSLPVTPTLLPVPLPARYRIWFGEPMRFGGSPDEEDAELEAKVREVRSTLQAMIERGLRERRGVFF